ncbi:hypothetical protein F5Y13DRAFT_189570 [Hypoxylon sp. FL1857]|nr:hypothetical protein F5Y13DRAFT_189570 [Hypoxylon sp. FL1857]
MDDSTSSFGGICATQLPSPASSATSSALSTRTIVMSLVAVEVTSPDTIVVAQESGSPQLTQSLPILNCEGPIIYVRKGEKFDITIHVERDDDDAENAGASQNDPDQPTAEIDIGYEEPEGLSGEVQAISNSSVDITLSAGKSYGLSETGGDILDLSRIELSDVAIHELGHYFLHLIIEAVETEDDQEVTEVLAQIITQKIQVSE